MAHPHRNQPALRLVSAVLLVLGTLAIVGSAGTTAWAGEDRVYRHSYDRMSEEEERELEEALEEALSHLDGLGEEISHMVETALADLEIEADGHEIVIRGLPRDDQFDLHTAEFERHMEVMGERLAEQMSRLAERLSERFDSEDRMRFRFDHDSDVDDAVGDLERRMERLKRELRALERDLERRGH